MLYNNYQQFQTNIINNKIKTQIERPCNRSNDINSNTENRKSRKSKNIKNIYKNQNIYIPTNKNKLKINNKNSFHLNRYNTINYKKNNNSYENRIFDSTSNINNFKNLKRHNSAKRLTKEEIKKQTIEREEKLLHKLLYSPYTSSEKIPEGRTIGLDRSKYDFVRNLKKLAKEFTNNLRIDRNYLREIMNAYNNLINNIAKFIDLFKKTKYKEEVFDRYFVDMMYDGIKKEINTIILNLTNSIIKIRNKILETIPNKPNLKKEIIEKTNNIINLCGEAILKFKETDRKLNCYFKKQYIYEIIETDSILSKLEYQIINYIKSDVLNLLDKLNDSTNDNSYDETSTEISENEAENTLNQEIPFKADRELSEKMEKGEKLYKDVERDIKENRNINVKKRKKIASDRLLIKMKCYVEDKYRDHKLTDEQKKEKIEELHKELLPDYDDFVKAEKNQEIEDEERQFKAVRSGVYEIGDKGILEWTTGLLGIREEFEKNLTNLINSYINNGNNIKEMLNKTIKSFIELKNITAKYMEITKKLENKKEVLGYTIKEEIKDGKEVELTVKLKNNIKAIEEKISKRTNTSEKFKKLTSKLNSYCDEVINKFGEMSRKNGMSESEYIDKALETKNTIVDLRKKVINYLIATFEEYKNL